MNTSHVINRRILIVALVALLAIVAAVWATEKADTASATTQLTVGLDMKTTQGAAGTYGTLPTFEQCVDVSTGVNSGIFYIDVFVLNVTNLAAFNADVNFSPVGKMQIIGSDVEKFLGSGGVTNLSRNYDSITDSINPPVNDGAFNAQAFTMASQNSGSGVMARIKAQGFMLGGGSVIDFQISTDPSRGVTLTTDPGAQHPGDTTGDGIFDGPFINASGKIAVDRPDGDGDGLSNDCDNCPNDINADQANNDGDSEGDVCDLDDDNDGVPDTSDNCPMVFNPTQDGTACVDDDGDGVMNAVDNCPNDINADQENNDGDAEGDVCDTDDDNDGVPDLSDNCPFAANAGQENWNASTPGDACEDSDGDSYLDADDNCKGTPNVIQTNVDGDDYGDACDNCPSVSNNSQANFDADSLGDACDDSDGDIYSDEVELFTGTAPNQACASDTTTYNEAPDATPHDNNDDQKITTADVGVYVAQLNHAAGDGVYSARYDISMDDIVTLADVGTFVAVLNYICTP